MTELTVKSARDSATFGLGALGSGLFNTVPSLLLLFYMTEVLALPAAWAGAAVLIPKIWIVFIDPFVGHFSDNFSSRFGRRKPFMAVGSLGSAITFIVLFHTPVLSPVVTFLLVIFAYTICSTANALFAVPYLALPGELSTSSHGRTRLMAWRTAFLFLGILLAGFLAPNLIEHFGGGRDGYSGMSIVIALIFGIAMLGTALFVKEPPVITALHSEGLLKSFNRVRQNKAFVFLMIAFISQTAAIGMVSAVMPYYVSTRLGLPASAVSTIFLSVVVTAIIFVPIWTAVSAKMGKGNSLIFASALYAIGMVVFVVVPPAVQGENVFVLPLLGCLTGLGFAGLQLIPFAILPDAIGRQSNLAEGPQEAIYTGIWSAMEKVALGLGAMIAGGLLQVFGYQSSLSDGAVHGPSVDIGIVLGFAIVPAGMVLASVAVVPALKRSLSSDAKVQRRPSSKQVGV